MLGESAQFRTAVLEWLREHRQDALDPNSADSVAGVAAALLLGESSVTRRVRLMAKNAAETSLRTERDVALTRNQRLEVELARLRAEVLQARGAVESASAERGARSCLGHTAGSPACTGSVTAAGEGRGQTGARQG